MTAFDTFDVAVRSHAPCTAVVLGSGLGTVPNRFAELASISFGDVPGLVAPSIHGHSGTISLGLCAGTSLLVFRGRLHYYESQSWERVARPIRLAADWGVRFLLLTNAAGGIHDSLGPGDLMVLRSHLFLQRPLGIGMILELCQALSESKPACTMPPYSSGLVGLLQQIESGYGRRLFSGCYAAVTGPCYETPAEIRALQAMGADAVGMSTAFEAETAAGLGIEVAAISCITNKAAGLSAGVLDHSEVLANASKPAERISQIVEALLPKL